MQKASFAAGCFWGVESAFSSLRGVLSTRVGYAGGSLENPTYEQVSSGSTGHAEAVEIGYDPKVISYEELLEFFWKIHDPTSKNRQGPDIGSQYRSIIFYHDEEQRKVAVSSLQRLQRRTDEPIVTEILPAGEFYPAEEKHQRYYNKRGL